MTSFYRFSAVAFLLGLAALPAVAQDKYGGDFENLGLPTVGVDLAIPPTAGGGETVSYAAEYQIEKGTQKGRLEVTASIIPGYHTYSTTQPPGGPLPTEIQIKDDFAKATGPFTPDQDPEIGMDDSWPGLQIEEHYGQVTWTAPIEFTKEIQPESTKLTIQVDGLACQDSCVPVGAKLEAAFAGYYGETPRVTTLRQDNTHSEWSASLKPAQVKPGDVAIIEIQSQNDPGYHVYQFVPGDEEPTFRTLIVAKTKSGLKFGTPTATTELETDSFLPEVKYHSGTTAWQIPVLVPESLGSGEVPIELLVGFYNCNDNGCDPPAGLSITGNLQVASQGENGATSLQLAPVDFYDVADAPNLTSWIDGDSSEQLAAGTKAAPVAKSSEPVQSLTLINLLSALAGGFILNFMPCVLPVIGLKVMSFMDQSGNSRGRIVALNLAYVAGILAVMIVLALLTIVAKEFFDKAFGWGEQFTVLEFKVVLAALVFAMALSFLGVWEIPIPGFATSSKSGELMQKEGLVGAFLKGVLTTILATPCSGPLLGFLFGLGLVLSPLSVLLLYLVVGLGLALPFLVLCVSPDLIRYLPKPGAWMETLKQVLAFPLLLTAVFVVASIGQDYRIATLVLLIIVWFACWLIGRVPAYADKVWVRTTWAASVATIAIGAVLSFQYFGPVKSDLEWVPYNEPQLAKLRSEGKTVMLDFTANWCLTCQINTRVAIDKAGVAEVVERNGVVPMLADWTDRSDEIRSKLEELESNSIPLLVIYPADPGAQPILLRDLLTEATVIDALEQAGPSREASQLTGRVD